MKTLAFALVLNLKNLTEIWYSPKKTKVLKKVPYYSQWESRELVEKIINKELNAEKDPKWKNSGAKYAKEYAEWSWNGCGMACLKMLLKFHYKKEHKLVTLGKMAVKDGVYRITNNSISDLYYKPFLSFIKKEFNLKGVILSPLTIKGIIKQLDDGKLIMASVNPMIRNVSSLPKSKGGHLVLVLGYDLKEEKLIIHNPSGFKKETQEFANIKFSDFSKFFANRGIAI